MLITSTNSDILSHKQTYQHIHRPYYYYCILNNINIYESREKFMQLTIQKKDLLESIQKVSAAISSRTAIPILTGMKMDVTTDGVVLTGSDSDITIQSHIHVEKNVGTNDEGQVIKETIITDITPGSI